MIEQFNPLDLPDETDSLMDEFWGFESKTTEDRLEGMKGLLNTAYFLATLQEPKSIYYKDADMQIQKIDVFPFLCTVLLTLAHQIRLPLQKEVDLSKKFEIAQVWDEYHRKMSKLFRPE